MDDQYNAIIYLDIKDPPDLYNIRFININERSLTHERLGIKIDELKQILLEFPNLIGDKSTHGSFDEPATSANKRKVIRLKTGYKKDFEPLIIATNAVEKYTLLDPSYRFSSFKRDGGSRRIIKKISRKLKKSRKTRRY